MEATRGQRDPLYIAGSGYGRFYRETEAMWDDWCRRRDAEGEEDRGRVLPRSYPEVKAVQVANENEHTDTSQYSDEGEETRDELFLGAIIGTYRLESTG